MGRNNDDKLLAALLSTNSISAAAAAAHVGERTAYRRLADPEFRRQLEEQRLKTLEKARNDLLGRLTDAVNTMSDVMMNGENGASTRLQAARLLIDATLRVMEVTDIEKRLDALERQRMADNGR